MMWDFYGHKICKVVKFFFFLPHLTSPSSGGTNLYPEREPFSLSGDKINFPFSLLIRRVDDPDGSGEVGRFEVPLAGGFRRSL